MAENEASFTIDLPVTGKERIDAASLSVDALAAKLDSVSKASKAASDAVRVADAAYRAAEATADKAAKAVEKVTLAVEAQRAALAKAGETGDSKAIDAAAEKLRALVERQSEAHAAAEKANAALASETAKLDALKNAAGKAEEAEKQLTKALADKKEKAEKLQAGLDALGGPVADMATKASSLKDRFTALSGAVEANPYAAAAVAALALSAAIVAVGVAVASTLAKITEFGVRLADTRRSADLLAAGWLRFAKDASGASALNDKINFLTSRLPLAREQIAGMAQNLALAGLRGKALEDTLQRQAIYAARIKFGPDFEKQMLSLDEQSKVFQYNLSRVFGGLNIEPLLKGLQKLIALFDENTESGRAIKVVFESLFQPLVDWAAKSTTSVERFFLKFEIFVLKALIAIKPWGSTLKTIAEILVITAAIIIGVFVVAMAALIGSALFFITLPALVIAGLVAIGFAVVKAAKWIGSIDFVGIGKSMIDGLVNGIKSRASAVFDTLKDVATGAVKAAEKVLGIASPAKRLITTGEQTGEGMAIGLERSGDRVQGAMESIVSPPPAASGAKPGGGSGGAAGAKPGANLSNVVFNFHGVKDAEDAEGKFRETLTRILEGDAAQLGAAVPNA
jgi:hypothetical protein